MIRGRGSLTSSLGLVAVVLTVAVVALVAAVATGALPGTAGDAQPDAETVLDRTEQRYANAETLVVEATLTAETPEERETATVSLATAEPERARVVVTAEDRRYAAGTNGSVAWVQTPDGAVVALPVPDGNLSGLAAGGDGLPSLDALANESARLVPGNWTDGGLPANWTESDLADNWSVPEGYNWSVPEGYNWSVPDGYNWSGHEGDYNWSVPDGYNWSVPDSFNWSVPDEYNLSALDESNWPAFEGNNWSVPDDHNWSLPMGYNWSQQANLTERYPNVTAVTTGTETVDGTETYVLELRSADEDESLPGNATLWIATEDYSVRRAQLTANETRLTVDVTTTRFNASIAESTFQPPDGSALSLAPQATFDSFAAAQANTSLDLARVEGATFVNATVASQAGQTVAVQQYRGADDERVGLVSTAGVLPLGAGEGEGTPVTVAGTDATFVEAGDRAAVVWETDGVTRAVVADLPRADLVALAERVRS